jgi:peptidoglycan L-alanyl-D-glutamate endopeptidase CwlK
MAQDEISIQRINTLHPAIREKIKAMYLYANNYLLPIGVRLRITQALRTIEEQNALYAQGRTMPGKIVTNAKGGESNHNYGIAIDICILIDKDNNGTFETVDWDINSMHFQRVKDYFKKQGLLWGGDWKSFKDYPHFEYPTGKTTKQLKALCDSNKVIDKIYPIYE